MTDQFSTLFFGVFEPIALLYALASGLAFGATVLLYLSLRFPQKIPLGTLQMGVLTAVFMALAGSLFFLGQIVQAFATDPNWPRALARGALWEIFSIGIGIGLGVARSFAHGRNEA